jgi:hypothetical protein
MSDAREIVAAAVRAHGAAHVARALGLSREAVLAYAGNFPTQAGTVAVIGDRIGRLTVAPVALALSSAAGVDRR